MAAAAESGSSSESVVAGPPPSAARGGGAGEVSQWVEYAVQQALDLKKTLGDATDAAFGAAESSLVHAVSASKSSLQEARGMMEWVKGQYTVGEELVFGKIKEGVIVAASHPSLSLGIAGTAGLVLFKRPRRFVIWNVRRIFVSNESLLSDAQAKVNELRQSVNLVKNESKKLEERALKAEEEMREGRMKLIEEGRGIRNELRYVNKIEKKAADLKDVINELPIGEASRYRSEGCGVKDDGLVASGLIIFKRDCHG
ncbi:RGS1-HXK1-interacting protein 1 isoform X2 [Elaeis guineensis]|uniref:RGS1-HXK1-interacting protein 1 isoform X2 n=1 Tax=Elaeis guineensis var. tenera TaxID=51953 RepID=UPI003C6D2D2B